MAGLAAFYACSDKETPQPVVDNARLDALRTELRGLQEEVLASQATYSADSLSEKQLLAEIKTLNAQLEKKVTYQVNVTDLQGNSLADANVTLTQGGAVKATKTDANGYVTFEDLHGGIISASVDLAGFASLIYTADIRDYDTQTSYTGSSHVSLIPVDGSVAAAAKGMFTINLDLYANYDVQDDTLGGPAYWPGESLLSAALPVGPNNSYPTVSYTHVTDKTVTVNLIPSYFSPNNSQWFTTDGVGEVQNVVYENTMIKVTAAGANGTYSIKVPARPSSGSFYYTVTYDEFAHDLITYVPGGQYGGVHIDKPFSATVTTPQIYRLDPNTYQYANTPGAVETWKQFYYPSNN